MDYETELTKCKMEHEKELSDKETIFREDLQKKRKQYDDDLAKPITGSQPVSWLHLSSLIDCSGLIGWTKPW